MTKTICTGASGFIGSRLMKKIDAAQLKHEDIHFGNSYDVDRLFFLSTYGNMAHHTDYRMMLGANVGQVLAITHGFKGWLCYMSSSSVTLPVQTPYSRTKRAAEEILQALPELKSCIVRPYSVCGVNEQKEHLIPTLIRSCMEGTEMPFDPNPVHDFIDVEDAVDGLIALADRKVTGIHEFGIGEAYSNQYVREMVEEATGRKANVRNVEHLRSYDNPDWYCHNQSRFFKPQKTLEQSISEMVEAYKIEHGI